MFWIIDNFNTAELLIVAFFPLLGLLSNYLNSKQKKIFFISAIILLTPIISGYNFITSWFYEFIILIILSLLYNRLINILKEKAAKIAISILTSVILFLVFGVISFFDAFGGFEETAQTWKHNNYKIQEVKSYGFSGRPSTKYKLIHTPLFGLFQKTIQTKHDNPYQPIEGCLIEFQKEKITLNRCNGEVKNSP